MTDRSTRQLVLVGAALAAVGVASLGLTVAASDEPTTPVAAIETSTSTSVLPSTSVVPSSTTTLPPTTTACVPDTSVVNTLPGGDTTVPSPTVEAGGTDSLPVNPPPFVTPPTQPAPADPTDTDVTGDTDVSEPTDTTPSPTTTQPCEVQQ